MRPDSQAILPDPLPPLLTIDQCAALHSTCRNTVHEWIRLGILPSIKRGRRRYIPLSAITEGANVAKPGAAA